jgi:protein-S-isoprenylcysteine O-methyltransferase Ste14
METAIIVALSLVSLLISVLTFVKVKGKLPFKIFFSVFRGIFFFLLFYLPVIPQPRIVNSIAMRLLGAVLLIGGTALASIGSKQLMQTDLSGVKGIPDKIIRTGLYSRIRHPINLGLLCVFIGWYSLFSGLYAYLFLILLAVLLILETFWEEKNLIKEFGDEYVEYQREVGMFFPRRRGTGK